MACVTKTVVRVGLLAALAGGTVLVVAGPDTARALMHQAHSNVRGVVNGMVDDPVALRAQLKSLEAEYPKKISEVRADLTEVQGQIAQLDRELKVSSKVVELASADLAQIDSTISQAQQVQSENPHAIVRIVFNERKVPLGDAFGKREHVLQTRNVHASRVSELSTDLSYLRQQEEQLAALLTKLETERAEFQAQLFQLDAQIDSIARNERMIDMMEKRQETIEEHSRFKAHSLDQIPHRLNAIRSSQREAIEAIARTEHRKSYEDIAAFELDQQATLDLEPVESHPVLDRNFTISPPVIDVPQTRADAEPVATRD